MRRTAYLTLLILLAGSVSPAFAIDLSTSPNATEMSRLPQYCQAKLGGSAGPAPSAQAQLWANRIGKNWGDFHHYCFGLNFVNRYWGTRSAQERTYYLNRALDEFGYMVRAEQPDFGLRGELYSNRGEVFKLQNKPGEAAKDFRRAIEVDPKLTRPYLQLTDLYESRKQRKEALQVASLGLQHNPESKALKRRYLELGGKQPFPEPLAPVVAEPQAPPEVSGAPPAVTSGGDAVAAPVVPAPVDSAAETTSPAIGTPTNPYCRFCPE